VGVDPDALVADLRSLRRGLGARDPQFPRRLGSQIKQLCRISATDGPAAARRRLVEVLQWLLRDEPKETRLVIAVALALHPEADQRYLGARERWLAEQLRVHERTARRRIDEAIEILARLATEVEQDREVPDSWQDQAIRAFLRLDGYSPELFEQRTVLITADHVDEIATRFSLPRRRDPSAGTHDLITEILYGGRIRDTERLSPEHFRYFVELPRTYYRGETHEYGIRFRVPPGQPMTPYYALVPLLTVKSLDLTVRFAPARPPVKVWRLDGVAPVMLENPSPNDDTLLQVNRFGEIRVSFRNLRQGFGYGARWQLPDEHEAARTHG
jgi:hypothetical protein